MDDWDGFYTLAGSTAGCGVTIVRVTAPRNTWMVALGIARRQ